jgi:Xaa-Pro aminopeptidase
MEGRGWLILPGIVGLNGSDMGRKDVKRPEGFIAARVERVRAALSAAKVGGWRKGDGAAFLVTNFRDVSWLTGFEGEDSYLLMTPGRVVILSDSRYEEQIELEAPWLEVVIGESKAMLDRIFQQVKKLGIRKLGFQSESVTVKFKKSMEERFKKERWKVKLTGVEDIFVKPRSIKDSHEVAIIEEAIRISEGGFLAMKGQLRAGMTENEIAGLLVYEMRKRGAFSSSFDTIVGAQANGSLPHYMPGEVRLEANSPLLVDWGARHRGYCADLTRVLLMGKVPEKIREIYKIVLEAQEAAIAAIKPGAKCKAVDRAARRVIEKAGYGKQFGHGTGHGIGRDIHEAGASFNRLSKAVAEEGMIMTVEPGIYLPGVGGVRIEDDVLVTANGHRVLSTLAKDLASAEL